MYTMVANASRSLSEMICTVAGRVGQGLLYMCVPKVGEAGETPYGHFKYYSIAEHFGEKKTRGSKTTSDVLFCNNGNILRLFLFIYSDIHE
jgi:hypothetical protein